MGGARNLVNWGIGYEWGSFVSEGGARFGEIVVAEVPVDDEGDLDWGHLALSKRLWFSGFGLLPHCRLHVLQLSKTTTKKKKCDEDESFQYLGIQKQKRKIWRGSGSEGWVLQKRGSFYLCQFFKFYWPFWRKRQKLNVTYRGRTHSHSHSKWNIKKKEIWSEKIREFVFCYRKK